MSTRVRGIWGLWGLLAIMGVVWSVRVEAAPVSKSETKRLEQGDATQGAATTIATSGRRVRASVGEPFEGRNASSAIQSSRFKVQVGFVVASAPKKKIPTADQLDITVLSAKTAPLGTPITPKSWQKDVDPLFVWEMPAAGLDVAGYSHALEATPDDTVDTTGTSWNVAQDPIKRLTDGTHTFSVKAINTAGKSGKPLGIEIWVDTTAPVINTYAPPPGLLLNTLAPLITAQVTEPHSGVDLAQTVLTVNGSSASLTLDPVAGQLSASGSGLVREGSNRVELRVQDRVGNAQAPLIWSFTADVRPPTGSVVINGGATITTNVYVTLTLSAADTTSGVTRLLISNDPLVGYVDEPYVSVRELWRLNAVRGMQKVYVKFIDGAGNISAPVSDEIDLGLLAPETLILSGPAGLTPERLAKFSFSCPEGGCVFSYAFDDNAWSDWTAETSATQSNLDFGNHYFTVKAAKEVNGIPGIQPDEEDPTPAERTWIVGVETPPLFIPRGAPIKLWRVE